MNYRENRFMENFNVAQFETVGRYDIPILKPCRFTGCDFISYNYAKTAKQPEEKGVHFFVDDYQFERLWRMPEQYTEKLVEFKYLLTPDFSLYSDYPKSLQIYNHYRKHWLGAYWQYIGMNVIPTIAWSDKESFDWCFDGEPKGGTVAVSSVGTQKSKETKKLFMDGWTAMLDILEPESVIFYGRVPEECRGNIINIKAYQEKFKEAKINGW